MLAELSIIPIGYSTHLSGELAKVIKSIDESRFRMSSYLGEKIGHALIV